VGEPCRTRSGYDLSALRCSPARGGGATGRLTRRRPIVAESYAPGKSVCWVARRHGLAPAQLFTWRRLARRSRLSVKERPVLFVPAVIEPLPRPAAPSRIAAPARPPAQA
jgi:transposase